MTREHPTGLCPLCGGERAPGEVTWSADLGFGVVVVRNVPATVCEQCGEAWVGDAAAQKLGQIANDARTRRAQVEVVSMG